LERHTFNESEMALFFECMLLCAQKELDTADIVRDAMLRQPSKGVHHLSEAFGKRPKL
jgi:hypothetical protein